MHFLLSNDDGYLAPGLKCLYEVITDFGAVTVVAPDRNRSGASNSLTLDVPLRVFNADNGFYFTTGTPTDCVHIAITGMLEQQPDMVVSGINHGANLGDDVLYSGTVAAAMEGRFLGYPAIAVSLAGERGVMHYDTAARAIKTLLQHLLQHPLPATSLLNINVPNVPWPRIRGMQVTRLGHRHQSEPVIKAKDPKNRDIYWVGPAGSGQDMGAGTDFYAITQRYISITPLRVDLTRAEQIDNLSGWLQPLRDITGDEGG